MTKYYKGDNFDAFDQEWAVIEVDVPESWTISRAELRVGDLPKMTFYHPVFPLSVSLGAHQTADLKYVNECYLAIYDEKGRKQTLDGSWTFVAEDEVV